LSSSSTSSAGIRQVSQHIKIAPVSINTVEVFKKTCHWRSRRKKAQKRNDEFEQEYLEWYKKEADGV
jgi:uncharacterized protein YjaG (DUF416 family)